MLKVPDIENVISRARSGDDKAVTEIISGLMPCVEATAHLHSQSSVPYQDLIQEGLIGAVNSIFSFDASREAGFATYAQRCISNSIISAVRKGNGKKQSVLNNSVPLDDVLITAEPHKSNPEAIVSMNERIESIYTFISTQLTELERDTILLHIADESIAQIAQKLDISEKSASNALARARKKLNSAFNNI